MISESNNGGMYMPVAPAYGNGGGWGGDNGWWIILLLLACGGGWGGFGGMGGWGGMMGMGMMDGMWSFPWILNGQNNLSGQMSDGFRDQMLNTSLNSIQNGVTSGFGDVQTALCGGFAGVNASINGAQNALAQQLYTNQISDLERSFAAQTATAAGFTGVQSGLCDIRYGNATNTRDIIESQNRGTQAVLDKLCQLELDGYKREADQLRAENSVLKNQGFIANEINQQNEVFYNRLKNCPVNAVPVAGNTPLFSCNPSFNTPGCGCGCGNNF